MVVQRTPQRTDGSMDGELSPVTSVADMTTTEPASADSLGAVAELATQLRVDF